MLGKQSAILSKLLRGELAGLYVCSEIHITNSKGISADAATKIRDWSILIDIAD